MALIPATSIVVLPADVPKFTRISPTPLTWIELDFTEATYRTGPTMLSFYFSGAIGYVAFSGLTAGDAVDTDCARGDGFGPVMPCVWRDIPIDPEVTKKAYVAVQKATCVSILLSSTERERSRP